MANNIAIKTVMVRDLKGAFRPNLPFGSLKMGTRMARRKDNSGQKPDSKVIDVSCIRKAKKPDPDRINFLGREIEADEYKMICNNLREFFSLLKSWRDKNNDLETSI